MNTLLVAAVITGLALCGSLADGGQRPTTLAAASNFGHGWSEETLRAARALGVTDFRDTITWSNVEREPGSYVFETARTAYPALIGGQGGTVSLTLNWGNPLYDDGFTPHTKRAAAAMGRFAAAAMRAHGAVSAIEVGNEFNGGNFVDGPVKAGSLGQRVRLYAQLLAEVHEQVKAENPAVRIVGGATHSIPAGYIWGLLDLGAAKHMDALAIHPYTTAPEQFARQVGVLRRHPAARDLPLEITEFGTEDAGAAPGYMLKMYAAMAAAGAARAVWYPLNERRDATVPLLDRRRVPTPAGESFAFISGRLAKHPARDVSPDPFTYAYRFGRETLVLWGETRTLSISPEAGARVLDATGRELQPAPEALSPDAPIVVVGKGSLRLGGNVRLGPTRVVADSFHQFHYPSANGDPAPEDPFQRLARHRDRDMALRTMPGQEAGGTLWTPYLGLPRLRPARIAADHLVPGMIGSEPVSIVHRYRGTRDERLRVLGRWAPSPDSDDGISVAVLLNGETLATASGVAEARLALDSVRLIPGDILDFVVGPNGNAKGDITEYRITLIEKE